MMSSVTVPKNADGDEHAGKQQAQQTGSSHDLKDQSAILEKDWENVG